MSGKVLVTGVTSRVGKYLAQELRQRNYLIRAIMRGKRSSADLPIDEIIQADITDAASLVNICDGVDYVISCAGAAMNLNDFKNKTSFYQVDYQGNLNLLAEAKKRGVKKFVYLSLAHAEKLIHTEYVAAHENFVGKLRGSGLPYAVIRPTGFFSFYAEAMKMAKRGPLVVIGDGHCKTNPVHELNVAQACVEALTSNQQEIVLGGPDTFTRREICQIAFEALDKKPRLISLPPSLMRLMILPLRLFNQRLYALMEFGIEVTQVDVVAPQCGSQRLKEFFTQAFRQ
jgi:uncharacterized protein YbjT (DUF2867 family)